MKVDEERLKLALPNSANIEIADDYIHVKIDGKSLSEEDFNMVIDWQRDIIGKENISEFYTIENGRNWKIYLKN